MSENSNQYMQQAGRWTIGGGLFSGLSAFIGASCCVLPLILFNAGVSSAAIAQLVIFAEYKDEFLISALLLLATGAFLAFRGGRSPPRHLKFALGFALACIIAAYILPFYESELLVLFGFRGN